MRGMKIFALMAVVVLLVGFMACGQDEKATTKTKAGVKAATASNTEADPKKVESEKVDPLVAARMNAAAAKKQAEDITGKKLPAVSYEVKGEGGNALILVVVVIALAALLLGVIAMVLILLHLRGDEEDEDEEGEEEDDEEDEHQEPGDEDRPGRGPRGGALGLLLAVGIALSAPVASAGLFVDKTAREMGVANLEASKAIVASIDALHKQVAEAKADAVAAKAAADKAVEEVETKIDKAVEKAGAGDAAKIKELEEALKSFKQRYILQGGNEEKAVLGYIVTAAGVDLEKQPKLQSRGQGLINCSPLQCRLA